MRVLLSTIGSRGDVQPLVALAEEWVLFHVGWGMSAFNTKDGRFAWFDSGSDSPSRIFESLDDWYTHILRAEFAGHYGL